MGSRTLTVDHAAALRTILSTDPTRWRALGVVDSLGLPDCWIGAGFIRNAVWDRLHGRGPARVFGDVDVIWFDPSRPGPAEDAPLEADLRSRDLTLNWSVKNQARMHARNGDRPYTSSTDAMGNWPETATAVAVRRTGLTGIEIAAPFGLDDLFALVIRATPAFTGGKHNEFLDRVGAKDWLKVWPRLRLC